MAQFAEFRIGIDREVDTPVRLVCVFLFDQGFDQFDHLRDVFGCFGVVIEIDGVQIAQVGQQSIGLPGTEFEPIHTKLFGLAQDVIVNVGDVLNVGNVEALAAEITDQNIKRKKCERVADMRGVVRGHAADIDSNLVVDRRKWLDHSRLRIEKTHRCRCSHGSRTR